MEDFQIIRGFRFPGPLWFPKTRIEDILDYVPLDGDIIIASYPKTGTTWLQYIVLQIISRGEWFPTFDDVLKKIAPFMEMTGVKVVEELKEPRIYKHHCPYNLVQKNEKTKYLYTYRKPEDTFVSYYHFLKSALSVQPLDFNKFFENFLSGNVGYGRYFEHVLSYLKHKDDQNLLLVSYEKLHVNRKEEILRIAKFLGEEYYQDIVKDESILEKIIENTSFDHMKKNLYLTKPKPDEQENSSEGEDERVEFFRKGIIGDGKKSLSPDQLKRLREVVAEVVKGTELVDEWLKE